MSSSSADADAAAVGEASTFTGRHLMNCIDKHIVKTNTQSQTQPFNGSSVAMARHVPQTQSGRVVGIAEIRGEKWGCGGGYRIILARHCDE